MKSELEIQGKEFLNFCKEKKKVTLLVLAVVLFLTGMQTISFFSRSGSYITDEKGRVVAIARENIDKGLSVPIKVKAIRGNLQAEQSLILSLPGKTESGKQKEKQIDEEEELLSQIISLTNEVELSGAENVRLPDRLADGTRILWYREKTRPSFVTFLLFPLMMVLLYRDSIQKKRDTEKRKTEIVRKSLPGFNNQLLLLLNSGLIFHDAFIRIAEGYERRKEEKTYFTEMITEIKKKAALAGNSLVTVLDDYGKKLSIKEFTRITNIITDNQYKGVNLSEKLEAESEILWTERKKIAEEKGRIAETKLTFPLALLLLVLIMITAAPAIMEM